MAKRLTLYVKNLDCANEAAAIERGLRATAGVRELKVSPKAAKVELEVDEDVLDERGAIAKLTALGFPTRKRGDDSGPPVPWKNPKVIASLASGALLLGGWLASTAGTPRPIVVGVYIASMVVGGYHFAGEALEELFLERRVGIELLMTVAAVVATALGEPGEGAMLAFLYSISEAAEGYTEEKTRSAVRALMKLTPKIAIVRREGRELELPAEDLRVDDVFVVRPGASVVTDGVVVAGASSLDESPVTGESVPVDKQIGAVVFAGTINGEGALEVRATKTFAENTVARIIHMVEEAQEKKATSERFIERFGHRYSPAVLLLGALIAIVPPLALGAAWMTWLVRATVFIVAAAPCALVISIPITLVATLGTGARKGVLIKGGTYVEELAKIRVVALDKTGTLTEGRPEVTDVIVADGFDRETLIGFAGATEQPSQHPVARAIVRYATEQSVPLPAATDFKSLTGAGVTVRVDGREVYIGSPTFFETALAIDFAHLGESIAKMQTEAKTVVLVAIDGRLAGSFAVRDRLRDNAKRAIAAFHAAGVSVAMLTGDNERAAKAVATEVGIDTVHAGLKPEDKARIVGELSKSVGRVAMVGDGVNDAPALAAATVGVALGAAGTDVALETADVALMADDLEKLVYALQLARRNARVIRQNLAISVVVIGVLVLGALLGRFSLPIAVVGHELSEFVVIASGLRMLRG